MSLLFSTLLVIVVWALVIVGAFRLIKKLLRARVSYGTGKRVAAYTLSALFGIILIVMTMKPLGPLLAIRPFIIVGNSMLPTLGTISYAYANAIDREFDRKDIVVYRLPQDPDRFLVARIVGLPSEHFEIKTMHGDIYINGRVLDETEYWSDESVTHPEMSVTLAGDEYFLLGDNRGNARDSRAHGPVQKKDIIGTVFYRLPL